MSALKIKRTGQVRDEKTNRPFGRFVFYYLIGPLKIRPIKKSTDKIPRIQPKKKRIIPKIIVLLSLHKNRPKKTDIIALMNTQIKIFSRAGLVMYHFISTLIITPLFSNKEPCFYM